MKLTNAFLAEAIGLLSFGTEFSIVAYGSIAGLLESATEGAFEEPKRIDAMLSDYLPDSELSRLNRGAADCPVEVSRKFFDLILHSGPRLGRPAPPWRFPAVDV